MIKQKTVEERLEEVERRIEKIEAKLEKIPGVEEVEMMGGLHRMAKDLVIRHGKASTIFLQRKLLIDQPRATKILQKLESEGVVGPMTGAEPRKVLIKQQPLA